MSKIILVTVLVACLAMMVSAGPVKKETRAVKFMKQLRDSGQTQEEINTVYSVFDGDGDGLLDQAELTQFLSIIDSENAEGMVGLVLLFGDKDADQKISKTEMVEIINAANDL
ncbi:troponin C, skeletal muscle-like [Octopus sinensis]|uniref:Troponin C, skeletal muscle-like n=1 Tax=Octopus sinensis TaxID=2607531 RepID=A0A6P7TXV7_9MOLL|nr:troponin C, skeletal muscle-like [Octopus sinensis]